jgi:hypothetical protein
MKSRRYGLLVAVVGLMTAFAMAPLAQAKTPNPGYTQFAGCPSPFTENAEIVTCIRSDITGGKFKMGSKEVPIEKQITLTGGVKNGFGQLYYNSEGGLTKAKQKFRAGLSASPV